MTIWRMRTACWMSKATHIHAHARARALRTSNTDCFSTTIIVARTRFTLTWYILCVSCDFVSNDTDEHYKSLLLFTSIFFSTLLSLRSKYSISTHFSNSSLCVRPFLWVTRFYTIIWVTQVIIVIRYDSSKYSIFVFIQQYAASYPVAKEKPYLFNVSRNIFRENTIKIKVSVTWT
jgi:hypothetical protein